MLNRRDTATVLFALRDLQERLKIEAETANELADSPYFDGLPLPTASDIDHLCQWINYGDPLVIVVKGGCVQEVIHTWAVEDVVIVDRDTDGSDNVVEIPDPEFPAHPDRVTLSLDAIRHVGEYDEQIYTAAKDYIKADIAAFAAELEDTDA